MKIVLQCFNYAPHELGGSERSTRDLARGLAARGHEIRVVLSDGSKPYPPELDGTPIDIVEGLPIGRSPLHGQRRLAARMAWVLRGELDPTLFPRALAYLRRHRPNIVFMNNPAGHGTAMLAACRATGTPVAPILRDYGWFCAYGVMMRGEQPCEGLCGRCRALLSLRVRMLRQAPVVVAISEHMARLAREALGEQAVQVIYNAVPDLFLDAPRPPRENAEGPLVFGYLGRLHPSKGVGVLLAAWADSGLHVQGHRLLLAGDGAGIDLPADPGAIGVEILGRQDAVSFLDRLDVSILPALWAEPFGRSIVESLARGLFVVGSPRGGIPELVPPDRGIILPTVDPATLRNVLIDLASDPARARRTRLSDPAPALARFRAARMLDEYEALAFRFAKESPHG